MSADAEALKRAAAEAAVALVTDGMTVGLGSGSTAELFLAALARRAAAGLRLRATVPTSERVAELARAAGLAPVALADVDRIDLTVDGADEIEPTALGLIKGRGGALLREKLVAAASASLCIVADRSKLVTTLGERQPVPVAVVPFGWRQTAARIEQLGATVALRRQDGRADGPPVRTDDDLYLLDCRFGPIHEPTRLAAALKGTLGVVEHGLFLGLAARAILAAEDGVCVIEARAEGR